MPDVESQKIINNAYVAHRRGKWEEAATLYKRAAELYPDVAVIYHLWALLDLDLDHKDLALEKLQKALSIDPTIPEIHISLGELYLENNEAPLASTPFHHALDLSPKHPDALWGLGRSYELQGKAKEAVSWYSKCLEVEAKHPDAMLGLAVALHDSGDADGALKQFQKLVQAAPDDLDLRYNLGFAMENAGDIQGALECYEKVLSVAPSHSDAGLNAARLYMEQNAWGKAECLLTQILKENPDSASVHMNIAKTKQFRGEQDVALQHYLEVVRIEGGSGGVWNNVGYLFAEKGSFGQAIDAFEKALQLEPQSVEAQRNLFQTRRQACLWTDYESHWRTFRKKVLLALEEGKTPPVAPFYALGLPFTEKECRQIAKNYSQQFAVTDILTPVKWEGRPERLKIGYVSGNFHDHPGNHLTLGLFDRHDRGKYEIYAYSFGGADDSDYRQQVIHGVDHFVDITDMSDKDAALRIHRDGIHILLDMKGYTKPHRPKIFTHKPAPIIAGFLGYAGTTELDSHDFILTDRTVTPPQAAANYSETFIYLPQQYQPNNDRQKCSEEVISRAQAGLPTGAFVFCCFNQSYKIEPEVFSRWMKILNSVENSVLWLLSYGQEVQSNLRKEASEQNIDPDRLIFAPRIPRRRHLARHRLADLFLDTFHYNAHTTASDSLFCGVPVLTCPGQTFASRVATSLVIAAGLPELAVPTLQDYVSTAVRLATKKEELLEYKNYLERSILESPLFDTARFVEGLENCFEEMWERQIFAR